MTNALRRRLRGIIVALTLAGSLGAAAMAQSAPSVSVPFSMNSVGQGPIIPLSGQSTCSISLDNAGTGLTLVPQSTSAQKPTPASQWTTATTVGGGSISTFGNYVGNIAGLGLTGFSFTITALSSGTVSGTETCSSAVGLAGGGGTTSAVNLTQVGGSAISLGQKAMSASVPVAIASDQPPFTVIPGSGWPTVDPQGNGQVSNWYGTNEWQIDTLGRGFFLQPDLADSGTLACTATSNVYGPFSLPGKSNMILDVGGITSCIVTVEGVAGGGGTWQALPARNMASSSAATSALIRNNGRYRIDVSGWSQIRVRVSTISALETALINYNASSAPLGNNITDLNGFGRVAVCSGSSTSCTPFQAATLTGSSAFSTGLQTSDMQAAIGNATWGAPRADAGACAAAASCSNVLMTAQGGAFNLTLTSASTTTCTSIEAAPGITGATGRIASLTNAGAAMSVTLTLYADQTCTAGNRRWGPLSLSAGQTIPVNLTSTAGWAYVLSSALTDPLDIGFN